VTRQPVHVLLVEDVPLLARLAEQMLGKSPTSRYLVTHKETLADALTALADEAFHVVLLDLNLPDSSGLDTVTSVIGAAPEVPIVVLTANENPEVGLEAVKLGAQDYLLKGDFSHLALDRSINYSIERHSLQRTIRQLALAEFAAILRNVFRKNALLVRLGGDEFIAMGVEPEGGYAALALQALEIVLEARNRTGASPFSLSATPGIAYFDKNGPCAIEELTALADADLYRNKDGRKQQRAM
jgi:PleD family two-component response regulator